MNEKIIKIFSDFRSDVLELLPNLMVAIMVMIIFFLLGYTLNRIFENRIRKKWHDTIISAFLSEVVKWSFYIIGLTVALHIMGFSGIASSLIAGAGVSAIIFGFAFKDIAENFLAGILLAINRPFRVQDIIEVEKYKGTVKGLDLRVTHVRTVDGRDVFIPNSMVVKTVLTNFTKDGLIRQEFLVGLDTFDDLAKARELILDYLAKQKDVEKSPKPRVVTEEIATNGINLRVYFWIDVFKARANEVNFISDTIRGRIVREVRDLLLEHGFSFPSNILEHKMYRSEEPVTVTMKNGKE